VAIQGALPLAAVTHLIPPVATIVLSVVVAAWIWRTHRDVRGVGLYLLLIVVGMAWQTQLVGLVLTTDWRLARFFVVSEKFVGFLASFVWVVFIAEYTNSDFHRRRWVQGVFSLVIGGYVFLAVTNPAHHLLFVDIVQVQEPFFHGSSVRGPVYFLFLLITYSAVVGGILLLARFLTGTRRSVRLRVALLAVGAVCVGTANLSSVAGLGPIPSFQYGGYGAFPFILATTVGVFGLGLFDLAPVARTTLVATLSDAVVVVDEQHRVVDYNEQALQFWPDLPGKEGSPFGRACPELASRVDFSVLEARTTQISLSVDGEVRHFSLLVSPVERAGNDASVIGHSLLLRDVTELETSRKRLAAKNHRLDQVAETISHDLRNPLNVARGYVDLVDAELEDPSIREHLERVQHSHDRMGEIIDDVLTVARQGSDGLEQTAVPVEDAVSEAWQSVQTREASLTVSGRGTVEADRSRLKTVFENLFRNAIEHAGSDVSIRVEVGRDGFVVEDDGPGLSPDCAENVFEHGYTTSEDGSGLGLAIVRTVADAHGWDVEIDTDHDGARVVFRGMTVERPISEVE
jgi:signal transduction histidine kinase